MSEVPGMAVVRRTECGRCGAEVREGKRTHFCGEPYPLKVTDDIRVVEYVPAEQLRGAVEALRVLYDNCVGLANDDEPDVEAAVRLARSLPPSRYAGGQ